MRTILLLLTCLILYSCSTHSNKGQNAEQQSSINQDSNSAFSAFLDKFQMTNLPITIKGCNIEDDDFTDLSLKNDRPFIIDNSLAYRQIPANGNYKAVITLGLADCLIPMLITYDTDGNIIDQKAIAIGYCSPGCGYSCEEFMIIRRDYSIYASDTISSSDCDSLGNIIPNTTKNYIIYKKGKLNKDGTIELTDEIKKDIK